MLAAQVILRVPMEYCLVVDYEGEGLSLPNFAWPRLREAVQQNPELPWDILLVQSLLIFSSWLNGACMDWTHQPGGLSDLKSGHKTWQISPAKADLVLALHFWGVGVWCDWLLASS